MLLHLKKVLNTEEVSRARNLLGAEAGWIDGRRSAGTQAVQSKHNQQLAQDSPAAGPLQALVLQALHQDPVFLSAALPRKVYPPQFNRYGAPGEHYGAHIDSAILHDAAHGTWVRSDLSCTVFLANPEDYDGGELCVHDSWGQRRIKLPAGDAVLYPGTQVHEVTPVTRGVRLASFLWIESMVRADDQRHLLFDMDMNLLALRQRHGETAETVALTGTYHNLLRMWAQT